MSMISPNGWTWSQSIVLPFYLNTYPERQFMHLFNLDIINTETADHVTNVKIVWNTKALKMNKVSEQ